MKKGEIKILEELAQKMSEYQVSEAHQGTA